MDLIERDVQLMDEEKKKHRNSLLFFSRLSGRRCCELKQRLGEIPVMCLQSPFCPLSRQAQLACLLKGKHRGVIFPELLHEGSKPQPLTIKSLAPAHSSLSAAGAPALRVFTSSSIASLLPKATSFQALSNAAWS